MLIKNWMFLISKTLNPLRPGCFCDKLDWNWPSGSGEDFYIWSIFFPCFVSNLVEIRPVVLEMKKFKFVNAFFLFPYYMYLPLENSMALHLNKLESTLPKDALCQLWLKLAEWFWRGGWKCEKFKMTTDNGQISIRKAHLSLQLRWDKNEFSFKSTLKKKELLVSLCTCNRK